MRRGHLRASPRNANRRLSSTSSRASDNARTGIATLLWSMAPPVATRPRQKTMTKQQRSRNWYLTNDVTSQKNWNCHPPLEHGAARGYATATENDDKTTTIPKL